MINSMSVKPRSGFSSRVLRQIYVFIPGFILSRTAWLLASSWPKQLYRRHQRHDGRHGERGLTMVLVSIAMVAIIAMAALSTDVVTLYLAREEASRSSTRFY
jgi:hypothetical protein